METTHYFSFDAERPLEKCNGETLRANSALRDYAFMGPQRSLRKLAAAYEEKRRQYGGGTGASFVAQPTPRQSALEKWSVRYAWQERIEAWEGILGREDEQRWSERRKVHQEDEWDLRDQVVILARAILAESPKFVKSRRRVVQQTGQEIITLALDGSFLIKSIELASKLGRLASGMETDRQQHEVSIVDVTADDMAQARERARAFEAEMLAGQEGSSE